MKLGGEIDVNGLLNDAKSAGGAVVGFVEDVGGVIGIGDGKPAGWSIVGQSVLPGERYR